MNLVNVSEKASDRKTTHANVSGERDMILLTVTNIAKCRKSERAYDVVVQRECVSLSALHDGVAASTTPSFSLVFSCWR